MSNFHADQTQPPALSRSSMAAGVLSLLLALVVVLAVTAGDSDAAAPGYRAMAAATDAPLPQALPIAIRRAVPVARRTEVAVARRVPSTSRSETRQDQPAPTTAPAPATAPAPTTATAPAPVTPPTPAPAAHTIRIAALASPATMQRLLDRCIGAIQVTWQTHSPEIAQHSNCGGAWYAGVRAGDRIDVRGGTLTGRYRANGRRRAVAKGVNSSALDGLGDVVLQTCIGDRMVLVGLSRI